MNATAQDIDTDKETALQVADFYVRYVRKWKRGTYKLHYRSTEKNIHTVGGFLLQDREEALRFYEENPHRNRVGYFPSEFVLTIDVAAKKVVEDFRPGQKERHPRP